MIRLSFDQLRSLTWITFLESLRHRAFLGLILAAMSMMAFGFVLSGLAARDQQLRVATDFGLFALGLLGVTIAIIMGVIMVHKEIQRKTVYPLLTKPVARPLFILGKFLGLSGVLTACMTVLALSWFLLLWSRGSSVGMDHVLAVVLVLMEVLLITSIAVFFSTFASPVLSGFFTFALFFVIGRTIPVLEHMLTQRKGILADNPALKTVFEGLTTVIPDLTVFQGADSLLHGLPVESGYVLHAGLYALTYIGLFLCAGVLLFQRRDFI
jgi:ABC-type transport system involved in multi-copper enzyme maturation permease subunit